MYFLRLFGGISLHGPSGAAGPERVAQQRPIAVLSLLAVARDGGSTRDKLIGYLWPESEKERARHRLADVVYLVRKSLGEDAILSAGDMLRLNAAVVQSDVGAFLDALDSKDRETAVELYKGPFLDGFNASGAPEFERWVESERQRLAGEYADTLEALAEKSEVAEDYRQAVGYWKRAAAHDPFNSRYVVRLMEALVAAGDPGNALQDAKGHERLLREELGVEPAPEVVELAERLQRQSDQPGNRAAEVSAAALEDVPADRFAAASSLAGALTQTAPRRALGRRRWRAPVILGAASVLIVIAVVLARMMASRPLTITTSNIRQVTHDPGLEFQPALSPDGEEVAYVVGPIGSPRIAVRSTIDVGSGGETRPAGQMDGMFPVWTPNGASLRFCSLQLRGVCDWEEVGTRGGAVRTIGVPHGSARYAWSRDGTRAAFAVRDSIFAYSGDNGEPELLLVQEGGRLHSLTWSPDGRHIAYVNGNPEWITVPNVHNASIWLLGANRGKPVQVTDQEHMNLSPQWLPDSRHLLFVSDRDGSRGIYIMEVGPEGPRGSPRRVAGASDPHSISVSADGRRLAYSKFTVAQNIWSIPIPSTGAASIRDAVPVTSGNRLIEQHAVSPDGKWMVFDSDIRGGFDIYKQPLAGGDAQLIADITGNAFAPDWSPDGSEIAFFVGAGPTSGIWTVAANGGTPARLTDGLMEAPDWSPDGLSIAFCSFAPGRLWIVSRDSVGLPWSDPVQPTDVVCMWPDWAPDGGSLVCNTDRDPVTGIARFVRLSRDGAVISRLGMTAGVVRAFRPLFSPDGSRIYFYGYHEDGSAGMWWIPADGGSPTKVVAFDDPARTVYPSLTVFRPSTTGREVLYLSITEYDSDIWVMDLEY